MKPLLNAASTDIRKQSSDETNSKMNFQEIPMRVEFESPAQNCKREKKIC